MSFYHVIKSFCLQFLPKFTATFFLDIKHATCFFLNSVNWSESIPTTVGLALGHRLILALPVATLNFYFEFLFCHHMWLLLAELNYFMFCLFFTLLLRLMGLYFDITWLICSASSSSSSNTPGENLSTQSQLECGHDW